MATWQSRRGAAETSKRTWEVKRMEDTIKIELLTPLTGEFHVQRIGRQWEEGNTSTMFMRDCHWKEQTLSDSMNRRSKKQSKNIMPLEMRKESPAIYGLF